jgi:hypothetical protein
MIALAGSFFMGAPIFKVLLSPDWLSALVASLTSLAVGVFVKEAVERRRKP